MKLVKGDFSLLANTVGVKTPIARYEIPRGQAYLFPQDKPFACYLVTKETFPLSASAGRTYYDAVVSKAIANNPLWGAASNRIAYATWKGAKTTVQSITFGTRTIRCAVDDTAGDLVIWYMFQDGYIEIVGEAPGTVAIQKTFYNNDLAILQTLDQYKESVAPRLGYMAFLPQNFKFTINLKADAVVAWDSPNSILEFNYESTSFARTVAALQKKAKGVDLTQAIIQAWNQG